MAKRNSTVKIKDGKVIFSQEIIDYFENLRTEENSEWIDKYFDVLSDTSNFDAPKYNIHHIMPCFTFKDETHKIRKETRIFADRIKENSIKLSVYNHILAHYCLWRIFKTNDSKSPVILMCNNKYIESLTENQIKEIAKMQEKISKENMTDEEKRIRDKKWREEHKDEYKEYNKNYRKKNKDKLSKKSKEYYENNKDILLKKSKEYSKFHKKEKTEYDKIYRKNNKSKITEQKRKWEDNHKEEIIERRRKYQNEHKDERKAYDKKYREENKYKINEYKREYRKSHKEQNKVWQEKYINSHKEELKAYRNSHKREKADYDKKRRIEKKEEIAQKKKEYYLKNRDKILKQNKIKRELNKEEIKRRRKENYENNKDKISEKGKRLCFDPIKNKLCTLNALNCRKQRNKELYKDVIPTHCIIKN